MALSLGIQRYIIASVHFSTFVLVPFVQIYYSIATVNFHLYRTISKHGMKAPRHKSKPHSTLRAEYKTVVVGPNLPNTVGPLRQECRPVGGMAGVKAVADQQKAAR